MSRRKNTKKLSLTLPSPASSSYSLNNLSEPHSAIDGPQQHFPRLANPTRRSSVISLPTTAGPTSSLLHRKEEEGGSPTIPYTDGPVQIIPGVWLGSEDNARDWKVLIERGIRSILNVAKEVTSPFDSLAAQPLRSTVSFPNLKSGTPNSESTYYPPHVPSGRPGMHYLKLQWSHGQKDLVNDGFQAGIAFADAALARGDGILIQSVLSPPSPSQSYLAVQLSMWHLAFSHYGHRSRYACSSRALGICPTRGLGFEGYAGRILLCQRQKQMDWP